LALSQGFGKAPSSGKIQRFTSGSRAVFPARAQRGSGTVINYHENQASNDNGENLIGRAIESDHGLKFKIVCYGRKVSLRREPSGAERDGLG
jgi:hypothetical protein